jgi:hypothetical protein
VYRLYIDEVGHHNMKSSTDSNERHLGLTGIIMEVGCSEDEFTAALNGIKVAVFGRSDFSVHRRELLDRKPGWKRRPSSGISQVIEIAMKE